MFKPCYYVNDANICCVAKVKKRAVKDVFKSAAEIAEDVVRKRVTPSAPCPALPSIGNLARAANRNRHGTRPRHPTDLTFDIQQDHVPEDFLRADIQVGTRRHLLLATDTQLTMLAKAKTWYIDGTFKVCI